MQQVWSVGSHDGLHDEAGTAGNGLVPTTMITMMIIAIRYPSTDAHKNLARAFIEDFGPALCVIFGLDISSTCDVCR